MGDFDTAWLDLREPYDRRALNREVLEAISKWAATVGKPVRVVDLGCGTGAAFRHLNEHLPVRSRWTVVDGDQTLLDHAVARTGATALRCNLAIGLSFIPFNAFDLVTASAFIDLVSEAWLDKLIDVVVKNRCALWLPLSATETRHWTPQDAADEKLTGLFNAHMSTEKGFGTALGVRAAAHVEQKLQEAGYHVTAGNSDWELDQRSADLQLALLHGYREAILELDGAHAEWLDAWTETRRAAVDAHQSSHTVGHRDVFAVPR